MASPAWLMMVRCFCSDRLSRCWSRSLCRMLNHTAHEAARVAAEAWRQDGAFRDQLVELEDEARDAGTGCLWSGG